jgi:tRNA dimethylallyltransferase
MLWTSSSNVDNNRSCFDVNSAPVIFLMGATATGKTDLAIEIARHYPVEIISVDSALIYRHMNIGTAKPDSQTLTEFPHFLVDIIDPVERFSVWDFINRAHQLIEEILLRGRIPLLVGGTMMYFNALENGLNRLPESSPEVRARLEAEALKSGWDALHNRLAEIDAVTADRVEPGDSQRIQRALEVFELTGRPLSELQARPTRGLSNRIIKILLQAEDRSKLHNRIKRRFDLMLEQGFIEEVSHLKARGNLNQSLPSMRCVGYRQAWQYLDDEISRLEMIDKAVAATRQLAKRQITWLRKQPQNNAFDCLNYRKDAIFKVLSESFKD